MTTRYITLLVGTSIVHCAVQRVANPTADAGVASLIPVRSHTFMDAIRVLNCLDPDLGPNGLQR